MSWLAQAALPENIEDYLAALKVFKERTILKVLMERDAYVAAHYASQKRNKGNDDDDKSGPNIKQ